MKIANAYFKNVLFLLGELVIDEAIEISHSTVVGPLAKVYRTISDKKIVMKLWVNYMAIPLG